MFPTGLGRIAANGVSASKVRPAPSTAPGVGRYLSALAAPSMGPAPRR